MNYVFAFFIYISSKEQNFSKMHQKNSTFRAGLYKSLFRSDFKSVLSILNIIRNFNLKVLKYDSISHANFNISAATRFDFRETFQVNTLLKWFM